MKSLGWFLLILSFNWVLALPQLIPLDVGVEAVPSLVKPLTVERLITSTTKKKSKSVTSKTFTKSSTTKSTTKSTTAKKSSCPPCLQVEIQRKTAATSIITSIVTATVVSPTTITADAITTTLTQLIDTSTYTSTITIPQTTIEWTTESSTTTTTATEIIPYSTTTTISVYSLKAIGITTTTYKTFTAFDWSTLMLSTMQTTTATSTLWATSLATIYSTNTVTIPATTTMSGCNDTIVSLATIVSPTTVSLVSTETTTITTIPTWDPVPSKGIMEPSCDNFNYNGSPCVDVIACLATGTMTFNISTMSLDATGTDLNNLQLSGLSKAPIKMTFLRSRIDETLLLTQDDVDGRSLIPVQAGQNIWMGKNAIVSNKLYVTLTRQNGAGGLMTILDSFVVCT